MLALTKTFVNSTVTCADDPTETPCSSTFGSSVAGCT